MKALKFKLFATIITLAAVLIVSINQANAQRRTTEKTSRETTSRTVQKKEVQNKSTSKNSDRVEKSRSKTEVKSNRSSSAPTQADRARTERKSNSESIDNNRKSTATPRNIPSNKNVERKSDSGSSNTVINRSTEGVQNRPNSVRTPQNQSENTGFRNRETPTRVNTSTADGRRNTGRTVSNNRDFYRTDATDSRYTPARDYNGRNDFWNERNRPGNMNYNHNNREYYSHYNFNNHKHWDRNWEYYRWNYNSWRDYYYGYNQRAFVYYKHYYHHPFYGHVIRRFDFRPLVFVHNYHKYYCYNGQFFRYRQGIGYVLVDLPFGFTFEMIPARYYERVYINGYLYLRVGNLFFESTPYGLSLTHFPERYYAWDNSYEREGYLFDDDYY